jgi:hypothetical protein
MNGATWIQSIAWQLAAKMQNDFAGANLTLLSGREQSSIAAKSKPLPGVRRTLAIAAQPADALSDSARSTGMAVGTANDRTGDALQASVRHVHGSLRRAFAETIHFLKRR